MKREEKGQLHDHEEVNRVWKMVILRKIIKAVLSAVLPIIILVVVPNVVSQRIPAEMLPFIEEMIPLHGLIMSISVIGVVLAILSFSLNMVDDWSLIKLLSSIASAFISFYMWLLLLGLGAPSRMGVTQLSVEIATITLDFRFFIILELLLLGISIFSAIVKFYFARKEHLAGR